MYFAIMTSVLLCASSFTVIYLYWISEYYNSISYRRFTDCSQEQVSRGQKVSPTGSATRMVISSGADCYVIALSCLSKMP